MVWAWDDWQGSMYFGMWKEGNYVVNLGRKERRKEGAKVKRQSMKERENYVRNMYVGISF